MPCSSNAVSWAHVDRARNVSEPRSLARQDLKLSRRFLRIRDDGGFARLVRDIAWRAPKAHGNAPGPAGQPGDVMVRDGYFRKVYGCQIRAGRGDGRNVALQQQKVARSARTTGRELERIEDTKHSCESVDDL